MPVSILAQSENWLKLSSTMSFVGTTTPISMSQVRSLTFLNIPAANDVPNVKKSGRAYKSDWRGN